MAEEIRWRLFGAWRSTVAGLALAALLAGLHMLGADGIRALTDEVSAFGGLLTAITGAAAAGLVLWRGK
jgi:hypothetical protein